MNCEQSFDRCVHVVILIFSVCVQLRQLPLIISFLALMLDQVHISMSLNVFLGGGWRVNAERSLLPHCFLFSEHSSEGDETSCQPAASNLLRKPPTATETRLLPALKKSAEHHSNNREFTSTFALTPDYTAPVRVELHLMQTSFIYIMQLRSYSSLCECEGA